MVKEFVNVFPEDLPGITLNRQVEFTIDLTPMAAPVSNVPCWMERKELQELKIQLQELLDKGSSNLVCPHGKRQYCLLERKMGQ